MKARHGFSLIAAGAGLLMGAAAMAQTTGSSPSTTKQITDSAGRMITKPLEDANIKKGEIPPYLLSIMDKPYDIRTLKTCSDFQNEVAKLTKLIGPDVDSGAAKKNGQTSTEAVLGTAEAIAGTLVPGTAIIRKVSGADAAQKKAKAAVLAGQIRRSYVKGVALGKGCKI